MAVENAGIGYYEVLENDESSLINVVEEQEKNHRKRKLVDDFIGDHAKKITPPEDIIPARSEDPKTFVMKYVFQQVPTMKNDRFWLSPHEVHLFPWQVEISRENGFLYLRLRCLEHMVSADWSVDLEFQVKVIGNNGFTWNSSSKCSVGKHPLLFHTSTQFYEWDKLLESDALIDGSLTIVFEATILGMTGTCVEVKSVKSIYMSHVFGNVMELEDASPVYSPSKEYYGVTWKLSFAREANNFVVQLHCNELRELFQTSKRCSIEIRIRFDSANKNGEVLIMKRFGTMGATESGVYNFCLGLQQNIEAFENYLDDGNFPLNVHAFITETKNFYKPTLCSFDESIKPHFDVVLAVQNTRFHVLKEHLAFRSPVFKKMLFGDSKEATQTEVQLPEFDPSDVQIYLELLYGESALDDMNVEGVALIGKKLDTIFVRQKVEEFLIEKSTKPLQKKFVIFWNGNLDMMKLLPEIKTRADVEYILSYNYIKMSKEFMANLLQKKQCFGIKNA